MVFLCNLRQGIFPRHLRESAFLLDHERDEALPKLHVHLEGRRHLEDDEQYWFLHALSSATHRLVLSYAAHEADGSPIERSSFLDEVERLVPGLRARARRRRFAISCRRSTAAESEEEFLAGLVSACAAHATKARAQVAGGRLCRVASRGRARTLPRLFRFAAPARRPAWAMRRFSPGSVSATAPFPPPSCKAMWIARFSGSRNIACAWRPSSKNSARSTAGRSCTAYWNASTAANSAIPVSRCIWKTHNSTRCGRRVEHDLEERLAQEPRFANKAKFLRDIEWESLRRMMRRFIRNEIQRAGERQIYPAYFEQRFDRIMQVCSGWAITPSACKA